MKYWLKLSIRSKIVFLTILISGLTVFIFAISSIIFEVHQNKKVVLEWTRMNTKLTAEYCSVALDFGLDDMLQEHVDNFKSTELVTHAIVMDIYGNLRATYTRVGDENVAVNWSSKDSPNFYDGDFLYITEPIIYKDHLNGYIYTRTDSEISRTITERVQVLIAILTVVILLAFILVTFLQKGISQPIIDLAKVANVISEKSDYSIRVKKTTFDEIGVLYDEFNEMLEIIEDRELRAKQAKLELLKLNNELEQRVLERTVQLQSANKELTDLAYISAHDLKTPLRGIGQLATWLRQDYSKILDSTANEQIELLIGRVKRMDNLVDAMLLYTGLNRNEIKKQNTDLNAIVNTVTNSLKTIKGASIELKTPLPRVLIDKEHAILLFESLVENGLRYNDKFKKNVAISAMEQPEEWQIQISDNGNGIEAKYQDQIFQIFKTLTSDYSHETTGIGLAVAKKIVELHGGKIEMDSTPGRGTTISFNLPK